MLREKRKKDGFTLAELLIVVAIIAVLVAVSIPIFSSHLEKARKATDEANLRACKSIVVSAIITGDYPDDTWTHGVDGYESAFYDAEKGCLTKSYTGSGYGQGSGISGCTNGTGYYWEGIANSVPAGKGDYLYASVKKDSGTYFIMWIPKE